MVGLGLKDGMASSEVRAGSVYGDMVSGASVKVGESISNAEIEDTTIQQGKLTMFTQSGTYTTEGSETFTSFSASFGAAPTVMLTPTQAFGLVGPMTTTVAAGSVGVSGGAAHTGNYLAWGPQ